MKRSERGATLIEALVVIAIVALIAGAATMVTFQVINVTKSSNDHMTAVRQVQNAGYWISRDTLMAQSIVTGDDPETPELEFITLKRTNWENGDVHKIAYTFEDLSDDGIGKLKRQHSIYGADGVETGNTTTLVAEYISYNPGDPDDPDNPTASYERPVPTMQPVLTMQIAASFGEANETREYRVWCRPDF